jgi:tetratricopeptide (TPR) repeat protein
VGKGDAKLWSLLNDKLDLLRGTGYLAEAMRVAETAVELAQRVFPAGDPAIALSLEKLGQLHDQSGDRAAAKPYLARAHELLARAEPPDHRALYRSARRLGFLCDNLGETEEAIGYYEKAIDAWHAARRSPPLFGDRHDAEQHRAYLSQDRGARKPPSHTICTRSSYIRSSSDPTMST